MFKTSMVDENIAITRGYNMAFGVLSLGVIKALLNDLMLTLMMNCIAKGKESDDADTRKQAVKALISVIKTFGINNIPQDKIEQTLGTFYKALNDYQVDRRGDVGSWVREEAMIALT